MAAELAKGVWNRKAGRYDYSRFDHIGASTSASVGYQNIGKVGVDCRFMFSKSKWGKLGPAENAAGIIYMELNFDQPSDCTLQSATVLLTLDEEDEGLDPYRVDSLAASECPVLITDYYGPGQIVGTSRRVLITQSRNFEPSVDILGNGASLGGIRSDKAFQHESRWIFRSHRVPDDRARGQTWGQRILKWEMTENDIEKYPVHSNKVFTAFAYEHSGQPFLMKVEISGRLRKRSDRWKASRKFGPRARKQEDISTTLIGAYLGHRRPLDELAKGLASAMEMENQLVAPLVMPDTQAASFQQIPSNSRSPHSQPIQKASDEDTEQTCIDNRPFQSGLSLNGQTLKMLEEPQPPALNQNRTEPTLHNLARVGEYFRKPIREEVIFRGEISEASGQSSATEFLATRSQTAEQDPSPSAGVASRATRQIPTALLPQILDEHAMVAKVMNIAILRLLIQFVVSVMDYFGPPGKKQATPEDKR